LVYYRLFIRLFTANAIRRHFGCFCQDNNRCFFLELRETSNYPLSQNPETFTVKKACDKYNNYRYQLRTEGGGFKPPTRNSEDIGGVLDRMSKKNQRLDFLLQFSVFSYGCNLLNKGYL